MGVASQGKDVVAVGTLEGEVGGRVESCTQRKGVHKEGLMWSSVLVNVSAGLGYDRYSVPSTNISFSICP